MRLKRETLGDFFGCFFGFWGRFWLISYAAQEKSL
jgi:hypothetical protein